MNERLELNKGETWEVLKKEVSSLRHAANEGSDQPVLFD